MDMSLVRWLAHHLEDEEIVALLRRMEATVQLGWFINDIVERGSGVVGCIGLVRWHPIVRHDGGCRSGVAFRKEDWIRLLAAVNSAGGGDGRTLAPGRCVRGRWK